jgi:hypothetical protein
MRRTIRWTLALILTAAILLIVYLLIHLRAIGSDAWAAITGLLAVLTAIISAFPALRVLELQEDALQPCPTPYFDVSSRYNLLQLRVRNIGPSVATDIRLRWNERPLDHKGSEITALDEIPVLLPGESVSTLVGTAIEFVKKYASLRFEGQIEFRNEKGRLVRRKFVCTTQEHGKRLLHDEELPKTLHDLQMVPEQLAHIAEAIGRIQREPGT